MRLLKTKVPILKGEKTMNNSLTKCRVYSNKDESNVIRIFGFAHNAEKAYVINCRTLKRYYIDCKKLRDYDEISEQHLMHIICGDIPQVEHLTRPEQKVCRDRYNLISSLLYNIEDEFAMNQNMDYISKTYNVSRHSLERYLNLYCSFGRIETLVKRKPNAKYDLKPKLRTIKYEKNNSEPGYALLFKQRLNKIVNGKHLYLYLLIDSYSGYALSYEVSLEEDSYNSIKSLLHRCLSTNKHLPTKINSVVTRETYCENLRNLSNLGIDIHYSYLTLNDYSSAKKLVAEIENSLNTNDLNELRKTIKKVIFSYNTYKEKEGVRRKMLYFDVLTAFKDSFVVTPYKILEQILTRPYKAYFQK